MEAIISAVIYTAQCTQSWTGRQIMYVTLRIAYYFT